MKRIFMLCGLPGCGKSTWAQNYKTTHRNCEIVSTDAIRGELYGDESIQGDGKLVFDTAFQKIEAYKADDKTEVIIFDATNLHLKNRKQFCKRFKDSKTQVCIVYFPTSVHLCLERNANRDRKVPEEVIYRMAATMDCPDSTHENFRFFWNMG